MALLWTCSNTSLSFLCWGLQSWMQDSRWGLTRAKGQNPLPHPAGHASLDASQDTVGFLGCRCTLLAHVDLLIHRYPQVLLLSAALKPLSAQPVLVFGITPTYVQHLALGLVASCGSCRPTSAACQGPSEWHPFPAACQPHHTAWCRRQTC